MRSSLVQVRFFWRLACVPYLIFRHGAGTGGTIAGIGQFMKTMNKDVMVVLADPEGSGLYNKVRYTFSPFGRKLTPFWHVSIMSGQVRRNV